MPPLKSSLNSGDPSTPDDGDSVSPEEACLATSDFDEEAIENFSFDASAAAAAKLKEQALTDAPNRVARRVRSTPTARTSLSTKSNSEHHFAEPAGSTLESPTEDVRGEWPEVSIVRVATS